jgi:hypothetical protein
MSPDEINTASGRSIEQWLQEIAYQLALLVALYASKSPVLAHPDIQELEIEDSLIVREESITRG